MVGQTPISSRLRHRVMTSAEEFAGAFDALDGSDKALAHLREATDQLMRAAARILIDYPARHAYRPAVEEMAQRAPAARKSSFRRSTRD